MLPVVLVGTQQFAVAAVDPDSLELARADGVGDALAPRARSRGGRTKIQDCVAAPIVPCPNADPRSTIENPS